MTIQQIEFMPGQKVLPQADILLFCRGEIDDTGIDQVKRALETSQAGAVVLRRTPHLLPAYFDPITMDITCATFDGFAVTRAAFEAAGGLDMRMGEAAATDLVWRLLAKGYTVRYLPHAAVHMAPVAERPYADRLIESLLMRCKHGTVGDVWRGKVLILKAMRHPGIYGVVRGEVIKKTLGAFGAGIARFFKRSPAKQYAEFYGVDFWFSRGDYIQKETGHQPLVSVVIRTYKRPEVLRRTLESMRYQTYPHTEIVVVEDGGTQCREMLEQDFADLNIRYHPLERNVGRAAAANEGFCQAQGEYINLLDDDDYLMPEHIEIAVSELQAQETDLVFLRCIALEAVTESTEPYRFRVCNKMLLDFPRVDVFTMVRQCVTTDNGVLFRKELVQAVGGMRTELGAHEDWSLFLRMMAQGTWTLVPYATCCYNVPADKEAEAARLARYAVFDDALLQDDQLEYRLSAQQLKDFYDNTVHDLMYLKQLGRLDAFIDAEYEKLAQQNDRGAR